MDIEYHLIRSDRRSIGIEVDREGKVTGKERDAGSRKEILPESCKRSIRCKDRILCPENGCDLWAYFHPGAEDQVGKLQQRGKSQLQLEAGADAAGSSGLCCGA